MAGRRPWFEVLEVPPAASADDVREAYLALVKTWHPDRFATRPELAAEAEERVKAINAAYDEARGSVWEPWPDIAAHRGEAEWAEWAEAFEPKRFRLLFVPGGVTVRAVALMLAMLMAFFAVAQALNALDLAFK